MLATPRLRPCPARSARRDAGAADIAEFCIFRKTRNSAFNSLDRDIPLVFKWTRSDLACDANEVANLSVNSPRGPPTILPDSVPNK